MVSHLKHLCVHTKTFVRFYLSCSVKYYALQKCFVVVDQNRHEFTGAFHNGSLKRTQRNTIYQQSHLDELQISQHVFNHQKREMLKFFCKALTSNDDMNICNYSSLQKCVLNILHASTIYAMIKATTEIHEM